MCRLACYLGPPRPVGDLLSAPHGLERQAHDPRELLHGTVNVDGTGFAWWREDEGAPLRYATTAPPWADANVAALAPRLAGHTVVAAVRGGTPGVGHGVDHVAPFVLGDLALAHNGWLGGFRDGVAATLLRRLPEDLLSTLPVVNDSRVLAACVVAARREGRTLREAVRATLTMVGEVVREAGQPATLNLIVATAGEVVATRTSVDLPANSLYLARDATAWPDAVVLASEPLDGPGHPEWTSIGDGHLVHAVAGETGTPRVTVDPLTEELA